jgi:GSH-dependent disulfide-bond oxidoreductase
MIELYSAPTSNGMRAKIMLDECNLAYRLHRIDLGKGENAKPKFLELNPLGLIPVIEDQDGPDGKSVKIAQSIAILLYLAEKCGRFVPTEPTARAGFYDTLMNISTDIAMTFSALLAISKADPPSPSSIAILEDRFRHFVGVFGKTFSVREYCAGDEVTIADFALFPVLLRSHQLMPHLSLADPNIERWMATMSKRPGVKKGTDFG